MYIFDSSDTVRTAIGLHRNYDYQYYIRRDDHCPNCGHAFDEKKHAAMSVSCNHTVCYACLDKTRAKGIQKCPLCEKAKARISSVPIAVPQTYDEHFYTPDRIAEWAQSSPDVSDDDHVYESLDEYLPSQIKDIQMNDYGYSSENSNSNYYDQGPSTARKGLRRTNNEIIDDSTYDQLFNHDTYDKRYVNAYDGGNTISGYSPEKPIRFVRNTASSEFVVIAERERCDIFRSDIDTITHDRKVKLPMSNIRILECIPHSSLIVAVSSSRPNEIVLFDCHVDRVQNRIVERKPIQTVRCSKNTVAILSGNQKSEELNVYNIRDQQIHRIKSKSANSSAKVAVSSKLLAFCQSSSSTISIYSSATTRRVLDISHPARIVLLQFDTTGRTLVVVDSGNITLYDTYSGAISQQFRNSGNGSERTLVSFSPDSSLLTVVHEDRRFIWIYKLSETSENALPGVEGATYFAWGKIPKEVGSIKRVYTDGERVQAIVDTGIVYRFKLDPLGGYMKLVPVYD